MEKAKRSLDIFLLYKKLRELYGPQHWWPVSYCKKEREFEIAVGAILTQSTSWKNVEKALSCLHQNKLLSARRVAACPMARLRECLRSSGYYKQKAKKLKIFSDWLIKNYHGDLKKFFRKPLEWGRGELLSLWGIGPETADSILLYAGDKPIFVVDAYTRRLCEKFGVRFRTYDEYRNFFEKKLSGHLPLCISPSERGRHGVPSFGGGARGGGTQLFATKIFNEFHALIVASGKEGHKKVV